MGTMKAHGWMRRTRKPMSSGTMEKVRPIVVKPGSTQKIVLKRAFATLAMSGAKYAIQLRI